MKFGLIDRIVELEHERRIVAVKAVSLAEEYLADHFPTFPVLPGVLMLEALVEAGACLVREAQDFNRSVILLQSAKNVTYKSFVKPGNLLALEVECKRMDAASSDFVGVGRCNDAEMVRARFCLTHRSVSDYGRQAGPLDRRLIEDARARYILLRR